MLGLKEIAAPEDTIGSILWLDDDIQHFVPHKQKLQARGIVVYPATTTHEAYDIISKHDINLCLVDLKLGEEQEGIKFIELVQEKHKHTAFLVYSNYAHMQSHIERLRVLQKKLGSRLANLPKPRVPSTTSESFDSVFTDTIESLVRKQKPASDIITTFPSELPRGRARFDVSLSQYLSQPIEKRMDLLTEFRSNHKDTIELLFQQGYVWLLFLGADPQPFKKEKSRRNILSDASIGKLAQQTQKVPFHFFSDTIADDFDQSSSCSERSEARGYPTLVFEFGEFCFETHFDTGLHQSHFDHEFCSLVGLTGIVLFPGLVNMDIKSRLGWSTSKKARGVSYFTQDASIRKKSSDESFPITLSGVSTIEWKDTRFFRPCYSDCDFYELPVIPNSSSNTPRRDLNMCVFRDGLVGRSLLEDNPNLQVTLKHGIADIHFDPED